MIGNVVANYKIVERLGVGGMGAVYKAIDFMIEREVAIKVLRPEFARRPEIVARFRSEATALAKLNHPSIATLYNFFRQGDDFFMVMEFVRGETLASVIARSGAIACDVAIPQFCEILEAIGFAHKNGIVHRDIKPSNVMLTEAGSVKVMDFGIARVVGTERMTRQGSVIGTFEYMSPEHIEGYETDQRSDIYSLGILLYEMLTGRLPFTGNNEYELMKAQIEKEPPSPRIFVPDVPQAVEQAVMRALAKNAEFRFQTAGDFKAALLTNELASPTPKPPPASLFGSSESVSSLGLADALKQPTVIIDDGLVRWTEGVDLEAAVREWVELTSRRLKRDGDLVTRRKRIDRMISAQSVNLPANDSLERISEDLHARLHRTRMVFDFEGPHSEVVVSAI
jgi:serine/threonine-protein kinase